LWWGGWVGNYSQKNPFDANLRREGEGLREIQEGIGRGGEESKGRLLIVYRVDVSAVRFFGL
jgi:hypothetical protein